MTNKVLSAVLIITILIFSCGGDDQLQLPTPTVQVYVTTATDVPIFREFVGETLGETSVDIAARVQGFLETRDFEEGSFVKKGQLLYTIESQPFEEKVAQASSQVAASQVNLTNAQNDLSRIITRVNCPRGAIKRTSSRANISLCPRSTPSRAMSSAP